MNSRECLERLFDDYEYLIEEYYPRSELIESQLNKTKNNVNKIIQDLDKLEKLELENASLRSENISMHDKVAILESENLTLKKIIKEKSKLEKELKQTKLNFKNSQTHSKNRYKKLKNNMNRLVKLIKDYNFISDYDLSYCTAENDAKFLSEVLEND